jgi:hypothetical protein
LKPEQLGALLVQEKYVGEKACDKRQHNKHSDDDEEEEQDIVHLVGF